MTTNGVRKRRTVPPEDPGDVAQEQTTEAAADAPVNGEMPAVEAFAHAMAINAHQHAGAVPEDGALPFPRPPFDLSKAWDQILTMRSKIPSTAESRSS